MRIGEALERLLSPQESGEDRESRDANGADAFHAQMDAVLARERARRAPKADDHAAAIVLDPRLVLSLQEPKKLAAPAEVAAARNARDVTRESNATDTAGSSNASRTAERSEAPPANSTEGTQREERRASADHPSSRSSDEAASESRAAQPLGTNESTLDSASAESTESANKLAISVSEPAEPSIGSPASTNESKAPALATEDGGNLEFRPASASAERGHESVADLGGRARAASGASNSQDDGSTGALARKAARLTSADGGVSDSTRAVRSGASHDERPADASESIDFALDVSPGANAQDFGAASDDPRDALHHEALATGAAAGDTLPRGASIASSTASFATMLLDQTRAAAASAGPHAAGAFLQDAPASLLAAPPVDKDAVLSLLSERLAGAIRAGQREVIVRLSPPDLGTLRVRFSLDEGRMSARVEVSDPAVHRALEAGVADLRGALLRQDVELRSLTFAAADHDGHEGARSQNDARDGRDHRAHGERGATNAASPAIRRNRNRSTGLDITA